VVSGTCEEKSGGRVSATVTMKVALEWLPTGSDAVHVTVVVPIGNVVLGGGEHVTLVPALPVSIAVGSMKKTTAPAELVASARMFPGTVVKFGNPVAPICGGVVSLGDGAANDERNASKTPGCSGTGVTSS
jgi:hypothetical protein